MKFFTKEVKIALAAILGIVVLFYGLQFLKGLTIFSNDDSYYVTFSDVSHRRQCMLTDIKWVL